MKTKSLKFLSTCRSGYFPGEKHVLSFKFARENRMMLLLGFFSVASCEVQGTVFADRNLVQSLDYGQGDEKIVAR